MTSKTISELQSDACFLHAMAQGVDALYENVEVKRTPSSDAMAAFLRSMIQWADRLSQDLDALQDEMRKAERAAQ